MARRDLYESGLKPSLATTTAKALERVIADLSGSGGQRGLVHGATKKDHNPRKGLLGKNDRLFWKEGGTCLNKRFVELIWGAGV